VADDTLTPEPPDDGNPADEAARHRLPEPEWPRFDGLGGEEDDEEEEEDRADWALLLDEPPARVGEVVPIRTGEDLPGEDLPADDYLSDDGDDGGTHLPIDASNMQHYEYQDLVDWGHWLIARWQLQDRFSPCWPAHHDLRAEVLALRRDWVLVEQGKVALSLWLHNLDLTLSRIERLWRPPCTRSEHWPDEQPPLSYDWAEAARRALYGVNPEDAATPRQDVATGIAVPLVERPEPPEHSA
jgi:hypothetical protein